MKIETSYIFQYPGVFPHTVVFCTWTLLCQRIWHTMAKGWCHLHTNFTIAILLVELNTNLTLLCSQRLVLYRDIPNKSIENYNKNQSIKIIHNTLMLGIIYPTSTSLNLTWIVLIKNHFLRMCNFLGLILSSLT